MRIDIALRHLDNPPPDLKPYIREKIARLEHFESLVSTVRVVASNEHTHDLDRRYCVEAVAHLPRGNEVVAKVTGSCLFEATDAVADRLEKQVIKIKEQLRRHRQ